MLPTYQTFADKDPRFASQTHTDFPSLLTALTALEHDGYYFRGQADASWKLYTSVQREWLCNSGNIQHKFRVIHAFVEQHLRFQRTQGATQLAAYCQQLNDIAILSTLQHFGGPTPFLDFTTDKNKALFFATDNLPAETGIETTKYFSLYAWKPGNGPATSSTNDLFNWEQIIDHYGLAVACEYRIIRGLSTIYIKQDTGNFLNLANPRLVKQGGLFLFSPACLDASRPLEDIFEGKTIADVINY